MLQKLVPVVIAIAALAAAAYYWQSGREPVGHAALTPADNGAVAVEPAGAPPASALTTAEEPEAPAMQSPARRIQHGTAVEQESAGNETRVQAARSPGQEKLHSRVESALEGNIDDLVALTRLITTCARGYDDEQQLQRRLDRMARGESGGGRSMFAGRGNRAAPGGSAEQQGTLEQREADMWKQFDQCQASKDLLDDDLRGEIARLAEAGQPSARYLYAIWPPYDSVFELVDSLELLEYQSLALEYTWMNLQERDPLGVLAMSQSYGNRPSGLFTPANRVQSQVFLLASMQCGVDNEWLSNRAVNFGQGFSRFQAENTEVPDLDADAAAIAEMFCPVPETD
jgi:hypothetical protein